MKFEIINTRTEPTIKVSKNNKNYYLHSKYDPVREASNWILGIDKKYIDEPFLIVIGMGAGYHIRELLKVYRGKKIFVYDFNKEYVFWIKKSSLINDLLENQYIEYQAIQSSIDLMEFTELINVDNLIVFKSSLNIVINEYDEVLHYMNNFLIQKKSVYDQNESLFKNFYINLQLGDKGVCSFSKPVNNSMILVSAGPSLTKQLPALKKAQLSKKFTIGCVGTALIPLIKEGVIPDFVMISDPKDIIVKQFLNINTEKIPLFYLSTANSNAVIHYNGPRYIVWQKGFQLAEQESRIRREPVISTGGSVATCLLDLMVKMGARHVALIGQDLAYTNNKSHAKYTHAFREVITTKKLIKVRDYYQTGFVFTTRNLNVYLNWFEKYVKNNKKAQFWNCTEGGAFIKGWKHKPFEEFLKSNI